MTSHHTDLMDLQLTNRRRPDRSIYVSTEIRGGQFVFVAEKVRWNREHDEHVTESTHVWTPADFSRRWRSLERLGWRVTGTRKAPEVVRGRYVAPERCACDKRAPKMRGKALAL